MPFNKGDIITGIKTKHPIIYLEKINEITFRACIITHSNDKKYPDNIKMESRHFKECDENGNRYRIIFNDTFVVSKCLIKENDWGPYEIKGQLTTEGIVYVERIIKPEVPVYWNYYAG